MVAIVKHTIKDYMKLPEGSKYQLLNGSIVEMPSPTEIHQAIIFHLSYLLAGFLIKNPIGIARFAPLDVILDEENVLQPDLLFIANENKHIIKERIEGAPDLVVEVLSPATAYYDWEEKMEIYAEFEVKEYWIINPNKKYIELYDLKEGKFEKREKIVKAGEVKSEVINGFAFELGEVFRAE